MDNLVKIGNYKSFIQNDWITFMENNDGDRYPKDLHINPENNHVFKGFNTDSVICIGYGPHNFPFDVELPILDDNIYYEYSFIKLEPGMVTPLHMDHPSYGRKYRGNKPLEDKNINRYWLSLKDYEPGHYFIMNDKILTNYIKGDVFKFKKECVWHGAANIGSTCRLAMSIITWSEND